MAAKNAYVEWIVEWLSPLGDIVPRAMMGGHIVYCDCVTFALVANNTLYLKADAGTRPKFEALGLKAFQPFPDKPGMSYYTPPPEFFEDPDVMLQWGREAVAAGKRAKAAKKPKAAASRGRKRVAAHRD
jgi:DNA transformation protein and related proteins